LRNEQLCACEELQQLTGQCQFCDAFIHFQAKRRGAAPAANRLWAGQHANSQTRASQRFASQKEQCL